MLNLELYIYKKSISICEIGAGDHVSRSYARAALLPRNRGRMGKMPKNEMSGYDTRIFRFCAFSLYGLDFARGQEFALPGRGWRP